MIKLNFSKRSSSHKACVIYFTANWLITKGKNTTFSRVWRYAEANVDITEDYQIQFTAFIESTNAVVVAIDDVKLIPGRCPETGT
ncbi:MAM and LDL-receptor class A domain-containing protein 2 [Trichonephila clavipes]|nr:MAM and LDL-receptor class A domain-containing protein 2 [Trichonephila clavipes]